METQKFEAVGIANILPIDYTFVLDRNTSLTNALEQAEAIQLPIENISNIGFGYDSFQRSSGGKIANILAYLGQSGHNVAAMGVVGDDDNGKYALQELEHANVFTDYVQVRNSKHTRINLIIHKQGSADGHQRHKKQGAPILRINQEKYFTESQYLLVGIVNKGILEYVRQAKRSNTTIMFHVSEFPWRNNQPQQFDELITLSNVLVIRESIVSKLCRYYNIPKERFLLDFHRLKGTELIVLYGGVNEIHAINRNGVVVNIEYPLNFDIIEPTGMHDCFHGALLSFLIKNGWELENAQYLRAALGYANEIAALNGRSVGARNFPTIVEQTKIQEWYINTIQPEIFVSYSRGDWTLHVLPLVEQLRSENFSIWVDQDYILGGKDWLDELYQALNRCKIMLLFVSRRSMESEYVQMEYKYFLHNDKIIIPIICDESQPVQDLAHIQHLKQNQLEKIIESISQRN